MTHRGAAFLWGAPLVGDDPIDVICAGRGRRARRMGTELHRPRDGGSLHRIVRDRIPVTSPLRTLVDLGAVQPGLVPVTLEAFLIAGLTSAAAIRRNAHRERRPGRAGSTVLIDALDALPFGSTPPDSVLETRVARVFAAAGLTGWAVRHVVAGHEVDFAFPDEPVAIEVDGWNVHSTRAAFERDRERDARLASVGWLVVRFTWREVARQPNLVARRVADALAARRATHGGRHVA